MTPCGLTLSGAQISFIESSAPIRARRSIWKIKERPTYWLIRRISTVLRSNSSKNGRAANPSFAGCMPASSYISENQLATIVPGRKREIVASHLPSRFCLCTGICDMISQLHCRRLDNRNRAHLLGRWALPPPGLIWPKPFFSSPWRMAHERHKGRQTVHIRESVSDRSSQGRVYVKC